MTNLSDMNVKMVVLTEKELEEIVYKACNRACTQLYDGLNKRYLLGLEDDIQKILFELEELNRN